jgi:hypothetical protein
MCSSMRGQLTVPETWWELTNIQYSNPNAFVDQSLDHKLANPRASSSNDSDLVTPVPPRLLTSKSSRVQSHMIQLLIQDTYCSERKAYLDRFYNLRISSGVLKSGNPACELSTELRRTFG